MSKMKNKTAEKRSYTKEKADSKTSQDVNKDVVKDGFDLISSAGADFRIKLIEQFQLANQIGKSANILVSKHTLDDCLHKMKEIMLTNPEGFIKLPSLKNKQKERLLVDRFHRHKNRTNVKNQRKMSVLVSEYAHRVLYSRGYTILMQIVIFLNLVVNTIFIEIQSHGQSYHAPLLNKTSEDISGETNSLFAQELVLHFIENFTTTVLFFDILIKMVSNFHDYWRSIMNVVDIPLTILTTPIGFTCIIIYAWAFQNDELVKCVTNKVGLCKYEKYARLFRLVFAVKFALYFEGTKLLIFLIKKTLRRLIKATYLFLLAMITFGVVAILILDDGTSKINWFPYDIQLHMSALVFLFRTYTGDKWLEWYKEYSRTPYVNQVVILIFVMSWIFLSNYLLANMFVGLLSLNFKEIRIKIVEQMEYLKQIKLAGTQLKELNTELKRQTIGSDSASNLESDLSQFDAMMKDYKAKTKIAERMKNHSAPVITTRKSTSENNVLVHKSPPQSTKKKSCQKDLCDKHLSLKTEILGMTQAENSQESSVYDDIYIFDTKAAEKSNIHVPQITLSPARSAERINVPTEKDSQKNGKALQAAKNQPNQGWKKDDRKYYTRSERLNTKGSSSSIDLTDYPNWAAYLSYKEFSATELRRYDFFKTIKRNEEKDMNKSERWTNQVEANLGLFKTMDTTSSYPEDTLFSYLVILGDLVENIQERQKLLHLLNKAFINCFDKVDLAHSERIIPDDVSKPPAPKSSTLSARRGSVDYSSASLDVNFNRKSILSGYFNALQKENKSTEKTYYRLPTIFQYYQPNAQSFKSENDNTSSNY